MLLDQYYMPCFVSLLYTTPLVPTRADLQKNTKSVLQKKKKARGKGVVFETVGVWGVMQGFRGIEEEEHR